MTSWLATKVKELCIDFLMHLKKHREAKGLTQEQLAVNIGLTQGAIQRWEAGTRQIPYNMIDTLASFLGIEPSEILFDGVIFNEIPFCGSVDAGDSRDIGAVKNVEDIMSGGITPAKTIQFGSLDPKCHIALLVRGESMNRLAPDGSVIAVDISDKTLVEGKLYVFSNDDGNMSFKRYKDNPPRLEPYSTSDEYEIIFPEGPICIIGRVVKVQMDL